MAAKHKYEDIIAQDQDEGMYQGSSGLSTRSLPFDGGHIALDTEPTIAKPITLMSIPSDCP